MMRSLFAGVSGLRNHQTRMDVIGNNIANVNTTGFKASRANFQDILSQTLQGASAPQGNRGGTNPKQIGLGMGLASIDTIFTDGSYQPTGKQTDLAISGQGFFVVSDGAKQYYTRAGNFDFDRSGNYVIPGTGLKVMGWMANADGVINTTGPVTSIQIPAGTSMPPKMSTEIVVGKNLSSDGNGRAAGIASPDTDMKFTGALSANADEGTIVSFQVQTYLASGAQVPVTVNFRKTGDPNAVPPENVWSITTGNKKEGGIPFEPGVTPSPFTLQIDDGKGGMMNVQVDTSAITAGTANALSGTVITPAPPVPDTKITVSGAVAGKAIAGEKIETTVQVIDNTGNRVEVPITLTKTENANEWRVNSTSTDITIPDNAPVTVPPSPAGYYFTIPSTAPITLTPIVGSPLAGVVSLDLSGIKTGEITSANAKQKVYDSLGTAHEVEYFYTKNGVPGEWVVSAKVDGKNVKVANDKISFNSNGILISPISAAGGPQVMVPGSNGAASFPVTMNLFKEDGTTPRITQFSGDSDVFADSTDGYAAGVIDMAKLFIDPSGIIGATFSNGKSKQLGQVALANFTNPGGLTKAGQNMFSTSNNSGEPQIGSAGAGGLGDIAGATLEMSNVDLAQQFSDMIITQRGFQANSKIITTTDEMLEQLANLKR